MTDFEKECIKKIDSGEPLKEDELRDLAFYYEVDKTVGENRRWCREVRSIIELCNRYFCIVWDEGLTEMQENGFYNQPYEVEKHTYEKVITVTEWNKI